MSETELVSRPSPIHVILPLSEAAACVPEDRSWRDTGRAQARASCLLQAGFASAREPAYHLLPARSRDRVRGADAGGRDGFSFRVFDL